MAVLLEAPRTCATTVAPIPVVVPSCVLRAQKVTCLDPSAFQKLNDLLGEAGAQPCPEHAHVPCKPGTPRGLSVTWVPANSPTMGVPRFHFWKGS